MFDQRLYESFVRQCFALEEALPKDDKSKMVSEINSQILRIRARLSSRVEKSYLDATDEIYSLRAILRDFMESSNTNE